MANCSDCKLHDEPTVSLLKAVDTNGDGSIDFEERIKVVSGDSRICNVILMPPSITESVVLIHRKQASVDIHGEFPIEYSV